QEGPQHGPVGGDPHPRALCVREPRALSRPSRERIPPQALRAVGPPRERSEAHELVIPRVARADSTRDQPLSSARRSEPPAARSRRRATPADTLRRAMAMASLALSPDAVSRRAASRGLTPPSSVTSESARARSLAERGRRSTIRFP